MSLTILVFHGTTHANSITIINALQSRLQTKTPDLKICFLKGQEPSFNDTIELAIHEGYRKIRILPMFLITGSHTLKDIPAILSNMQTKYPTVTFEQENSLLEDDKFTEYLYNKI